MIPSRGMARRALFLLLGLIAWLAAPARAAADELTLAVFAPGAQFSTMQDRLDLGRRLAEHLQKELPETRVRSRVYAQSVDFERAVASAAIDLALVDATYLALSTLKPTRVLAVTPPVVWQLVTNSSVSSVAELRGKRLFLGGAIAVGIAQGLFSGEAKDFFAAITPVQDSSSALIALDLGKAEAVLLPVSASSRLPKGLVSRQSFEPIPGMALVALTRLDADAAGKILSALEEFRDEPPTSSFSRASAELLTGLKARLAVAPRQAPMPTLPLRKLIDSLITAGSLAIPQLPVADFALTPAQAAASLAPPPPSPSPSPRPPTPPAPSPAAPSRRR